MEVGTFVMLKNLYYKAPESIQDLMVSLEGYRISRKRYGSIFRAAFDGYLERDEWGEEELLAYQNLRRIEALERASRAPFYAKFFRDNGADWRDFVDLKAFKSLPIITKSEIVEDIASFLPRAALPTDVMASTSGTTGTSFHLPFSAEVDPDQWGVWWRYRLRHGLKLGQWCGLFASAPVVGPGKCQRPYRINRPGNEVRFSIFHISKENVDKYVSAFDKYNLKWVHGNPTAIAQFCSSYLESGRSKLIDIDYLTVGSENLTPWQIELMKAVFGRTPIQHYGLAEAVANISELPDGRLAVDEDYSYTEFIDNEYDKNYKRIIGTSFSNKAISLLRYDTGDLCTLLAGSQSDGGQRYVDALDGRSTDYVQLPGGRRVASLAGPFHASEGLAGAQLVQHRDFSLTVRYVPGKGWQGDKALAALEAALRTRVGPELGLKFEQVEAIPKTPRGKSRLVVSELDQ